MFFSADLPVIMLSVVNTQPCDSIDFNIAKYILLHAGEIDKISLGQLAERCLVSKASISRFCRKIGLEDYLDLQLMLRGYRYNPREKFQFASGTPSTDSFLETSIAYLQYLRKTIDQPVLSQLVQDIHDYPNVAAFGHMQSGNVAFSLQHDLSACKKLILCSQVIVDQKEYLKTAGKDTLLIVFTVRGRFFERTSEGLILEGRNRPKIYVITTQNSVQQPSFVDKTIVLAPNYDYANAILMSQTYASLIALNYYNQFGSD